MASEMKRLFINILMVASVVFFAGQVAAEDREAELRLIEQTKEFRSGQGNQDTQTSIDNEVPVIYGEVRSSGFTFPASGRKADANRIFELMGVPKSERNRLGAEMVKKLRGKLDRYAVLKPLPSCSETRVRKVPIHAKSFGANVIDRLYYSPDDANQKRYAESQAVEIVPYVNGSSISVLDSSSDKRAMLAVWLKVRCLPTRTFFGSTAGERYLVYEEVDAESALSGR